MNNTELIRKVNVSLRDGTARDDVGINVTPSGGDG